MKFDINMQMDINPNIIINYIINPHNYLFMLNEHVTTLLSQYDTVTDFIVIYYNNIIYKYRDNNDTYYYRNIKNNYNINGYYFSVQINFSHKKRGEKITLLYDVNGYSAERSIALPKLVDIIFRKSGTTFNDIDVTYIGITKVDKDNLFKLKDVTSRGYNVFVSVLGSSLVKYLEDLYFSNAPNGIYHVNGFSTAVSLNGSKNLIRLFPPDNLNPPIFNKLSTNNVIILYQPSSIWSNGLANSIRQVALSKNKIVTMIPAGPNIEDTLYLNLLSGMGNSPLKHTLIILSDFAIVYSNNIYINGTLDGKFPYHILFGDSTYNVKVINDNLLLYLQDHDAMIIQPLVTQSNIKYSEIVNAELANSKHPVTPTVIYLNSCIDSAILLRNMEIDQRSMRKYFTLIEIDQYGNNVNGTYAGVNYIGLNVYKLSKVIIVNGSDIFIADVVKD